MAKYLNSDDHPDQEPRLPGSAEEWDLELAATEAAARSDVLERDKELIKRLWGEVRAREVWISDTSTSGNPLTPESPDEWELELDAFHAAGRESIPADVRKLIGILWRECCFREKWLSAAK